MKTRLFVLLMIILLLFTTGCAAANLAPQDGAKGDGFNNRDEQNEAEVQENWDDVRKIIKDASLNLETEDVDKAYSAILDFARDNGGYEFSHQKTVRNEFITIRAVIKIKPEKLDALMSFTGNVAFIINSSVNSDDITDKYYDAKTRLATKKKMLESYYAFLDDARDINEIMTLQKEIGVITEDIEALEGKIAMWNQLTAESTLTVTINQKDDPLKPKKEINWSAIGWSDMGLIMKNGFITVSNVLVSVLQWALIILASASPIIAIAAAALLIIFVIKRKKNKKIKETKDKDNEE